MSEPRIVEVEWEDSSGPGTDGRWHSWANVVDLVPVRMRTVGYVLADEKTFLRLCSDIPINDGVHGGAIAIPRCAIRKVRTLRRGK